jgi:hypothetical protein
MRYPETVKPWEPVSHGFEQFLCPNLSERVLMIVSTRTTRQVFGSADAASISSVGHCDQAVAATGAGQIRLLLPSTNHLLH